MANTEGMLDKAMLDMMQHVSSSNNNDDLVNHNASRIQKTTTSRRSRFLQRRNNAIQQQKQPRSSGEPIIVSSGSNNRTLPRRIISTSCNPPSSSTFCVDSNHPNHENDSDYDNSINQNHNDNGHSNESINDNDRVNMINTTVGGLIQDRILERDVAFHSGNVSVAPMKSMNSTGFPSLDMPIGQFTSNRRNQIRDAKHSMPTTSNTSEDAQRMLTNMTLTEIRSHVQELEQSLSPSTIAFLKERNIKKKLSQFKNKNKVNADTFDQTILTKLSMKNPLAVHDKMKTEEKYNTEANNSLDQELRKVTSEENEEEQYDLEKLTILLRSTSFRQRLLAVKRIYKLLQSSNKTNKKSSELPLYLPVSLRCLLDEADSTNNSNTASNKFLQSFTLRAMDQLLQNLLQTSYQHNNETHENNCYKNMDYYESVYSLYFLQDSFLPTSATQTTSTTTTTMIQNTTSTKSKKENVSYYQLTQVQSETSTKDGTAFYKDPVGTLLSRMKIIPRLAQILQNNRKDDVFQQEETILAIIHLFISICRKSPGAATVVAEHSSILPNLLNYHDKYDNNTVATTTSSIYAESMLSLIAIIARQSRSAAICITQKYFSDILSFTSSSTIANTTVSPILVWRILLSYGLATDYLQTMISLSIPIIVSLLQSSGSRHKNDSDYKEAIYFLSSFTKVCHLVKIISMEKQQRKSNVHTTSDDNKDENLEMSGIWLSSLVLQCVEYLISSSTLPSPLQISGIVDDSYELCFKAAQLQFIYSYVTASSASSSLNDNNHNDNKAMVSVVTSEHCQAVLESLWEPYILQALKQYVLPTALLQEFPSNRSTISCKEEASACAIVQSYFHLLSSQQKQNSSFEVTPIKDLCQQIYSTICKILEKQIQTSAPKGEETYTPRNNFVIPLAWYNPAHFEICKFAANYFISHDPKEKEVSMWQLFQVFSFALLGKLQRGEESMAAILLSQDCFFITPRVNEENNFHFSKMLRMELLHYRLQSQLDHSFKLNGGPGILLPNQYNRKRTMGPFSLQSLRRQVDVSSKPIRKDSDDNETGFKDDLFLLPLGPHWLWQILSSTIHMTHKSSNSNDEDNNCVMLQEATNVIISCLQLLNYMEQEYKSNRITIFYTTQIHIGKRLYHLLNTCMFPEQVLRDNRFASNFLPLLEIYNDSSNNNGVCDFSRSFAKAFIHEIYQHSLRIQSKKSEKQNQTSCEKNSDDENNENADEPKIDGDENSERILSIFLSDSNMSGRNQDKRHTLSAPEMKAVNDFISDICTLFLEYGAQYDFFVCCMRVFLRPCFPNDIRINTLTKLRGVEHLLTTTDETEQTQRLKRALNNTISSGTTDDSNEYSRDYSDFLDVLTAYLGRKKNNNIDNHSLSTKDFMYLFSVGCLARNLTLIVLLQTDGHCESMQHRLRNFPQKTVQQILAIAFALLSSSNSLSKDKLIQYIFEICIETTLMDSDGVEYAKDILRSRGLEEIWWRQQNTSCHRGQKRSSALFSNQEWNLMIDAMKSKISR